MDWLGDDSPPEEVNRLEQGNDYGWPYCYGDRQANLAIPYPVPEGYDTLEQYCQGGTVGTVLEYQAHSAPILLKFYEGAMFPDAYRNDAFVTMRGSWNRFPATGYKVVRVMFADSGEPAGFEDFVTGWLTEDGESQFGRVSGLLVMNDGSLLISDDSNGVIYRVSYEGGN
jgi:glucose/arabinose dehydrogenase